jgi:hypothetical protein
LIPVELQSRGSMRSRCYSKGHSNNRSSWSNTGGMMLGDETQCEMARLDEKIFETKKIVEGLVIVEYIVKGF